MAEGRNVIIRFSDTGPETTVMSPVNVKSLRYPWGIARRTFRQVGWLGQTGNVYRFDEEAEAQANEPGSYGPLYIEVTE